MNIIIFWSVSSLYISANPVDAVKKSQNGFGKKDGKPVLKNHGIISNPSENYENIQPAVSIIDSNNKLNKDLSHLKSNGILKEHYEPMTRKGSTTQRGVFDVIFNGEVSPDSNKYTDEKHTGEEDTRKEDMRKEYADNEDTYEEDNTGQEYTDDGYADNEDTDEEDTGQEYTDDGYADNEDTDEKDNTGQEYTDDEYADNEDTDEEDTGREYADDEYTDNEDTDDEDTGREYADDEYTDEEFTGRETFEGKKKVTINPIVEYKVFNAEADNANPHLSSSSPSKGSKAHKTRSKKKSNHVNRCPQDFIDDDLGYEAGNEFDTS